MVNSLLDNKLCNVILRKYRNKFLGFSIDFFSLGLAEVVAELYEEKDKEISTDIQKRFEKFDTYQQGCIVGYLDRLDDEAK